MSSKGKTKPRLSALDIEIENLFVNGDGLEFHSDLPAPPQLPSPEVSQRAEKAATNLGQSSDKDGTNLGQTQDKVRTNSDSETLLENENFGQTSDKLRSQPRTKLRTNLGQSSDKLSLKTSFSQLVGLQRAITLFIYEECKMCQSDITGPISIWHLAESCQTTVLSAQKTVQRLLQKDVLLRVEFKNGRGGWTRYSLEEMVFRDILQSETSLKPRTNFGQTSDKLRSQPRTQLRTNSPSGGGLIKSEALKKTTTQNQLPDEWKKIDYSDLNRIGVPFGESHLVRLWTKGKLTAEEVSESLRNFIADMEKNPKKFEDRLSGLMGILGGSIKKGTSGRKYDPVIPPVIRPETAVEKPKVPVEEPPALTGNPDISRWLSNPGTDIL